MSDDRVDTFTMIGLHTLASQVGDGLVPELHELLARRERQIYDASNVAEFPIWKTRKPGDECAIAMTEDERTGENVIAFRSESGQKVSRK